MAAVWMSSWVGGKDGQWVGQMNALLINYDDWFLSVHITPHFVNFVGH